MYRVGEWTSPGTPFIVALQQAPLPLIIQPNMRPQQHACETVGDGRGRLHIQVLPRRPDPTANDCQRRKKDEKHTICTYMNKSTYLEQQVDGHEDHASDDGRLHGSLRRQSLRLEGEKRERFADIWNKVLTTRANGAHGAEQVQRSSLQ